MISAIKNRRGETKKGQLLAVWIGIILSVIWFIGFAWSCVHQNARANEKYLTCLNIAPPFNEEHFRKADRCSTEWRRLDDSVLARFGRQNIRILLVIDFGTVVFGWVITWFGAVVVRWIRRGFG